MKHSKLFALLTVLMIASMLVTPAFAQTPAPAAPAKDPALNPYWPTNLFEAIDVLKKATDGKKPAEGTKFAFMINVVAPFWTAAETGVKRASADLGVQIDFQAPTGGTSAERLTQQLSMLETFVNNKYAAITFSSIDRNAPKSIIEKAVAAGIPVICMDSDATGSKRLLYIGMSDYDAGMQAGKAAIEIVKTGKMVAEYGDQTAQNGQDREAGFKDAIKGSGLEVVETMYDAAVPEKALSNAQMAMQKYPDLAGFLGIWSINGPAIGQAVKQANMTDKVKIVAFDAEPETQRLMGEGVIQAMIGQRVYFYGYLSSWVMYSMNVLGVEPTMKLLEPYLQPWPSKATKDVALGAEGKIHLNTGVDVVKADTFPLYKEYLESIGIKSQ